MSNLCLFDFYNNNVCRKAPSAYGQIIWIYISSVCMVQTTKNSFQEYHHSVKQLEPDQAGSSVGPDLGQNCSQRLSVDHKWYHWQVISLTPSATYLEFCAVKLYSPLALPCIWNPLLLSAGTPYPPTGSSNLSLGIGDFWDGLFREERKKHRLEVVMVQI